MASFAGLFNQENVGNLLNDPRLQLGLALMSRGRQGSSSQAVGEAGLGAAQMFQEQQRSQALQQYRSQMAQMQADQLALQQQNAQRKADADDRQRAAFQDPDVQAQMGPLARMLAAQGLGVDDVLRANAADNLSAHRQAQLSQQQSQFDTRQAHQGGGGSSGPRMPTQRQVLDQPLGNGMMQRNVLNPATGQYEPYGEPFAQYSPGRKPKADAAGADAAVDEILGNGPTAAEALPGTGSLQSYAPHPQQPVGVLPMAASGGGMANPALEAATAGARVPGQPKIATPMTKAEYDALPPGTQYIDPVSGKTATKRG
ncbi:MULTISPECIES: hypothetical protein [Pseudomonas]|uniref:hypothetical protein n=1 Tax=Pseudomonas TaxID=286 RepID=UPI001AE107D6|nr:MULTISPECIES: hypothetical protein [Pseudomonas]MBP2083514.1 hypothetical protein [Pseudomonas sp. PvP089]MBP2090783.1 hypothetical protein [Pseudomonas sp. PvP088]MBP2223053.1 hypothetical protein [Pseudomonas putida]